MIFIDKIGNKIEDVHYSERKSSYGILKNEEGQIAVVNIENWGLIFPGGKIEVGEDSKETIKRETLEEIGYEVASLEFYDTVETYYEVTGSKVEVKELLEKKAYCHAIVDFYTGIIKTKIQEPIEKHHSIELHYPNDFFDKMKLDFQNVILKNIEGCKKK